MGTNIRQNFADFFTGDKLPELEAVILAKTESYGSMIPILFNEEAMTKDIYQTTTVSGLKNPQLKPENSPVQFQELKSGFRKTFTANTYATGYRISKEMVDDGKFSFIERATNSFSKGMFEIRELKAAEVFDDGFTVNGYDGVPLFSVNHPLENGDGVPGVNRPAVGSELSITSYRELRNIAQDTLNENGQRVVYRIAYLVVPQDLQDDAQEIVKSQFNPENANNAINTIYNTVSLLPGNCWQYLENQSAFFLVCEKMDHHLMFLDRQPMQVDSDYDKKTFAHEIIANCRFDQGFAGWRGVYGNPGV